MVAAFFVSAERGFKMSGNLDAVVNWFKARLGKVTYSMNARLGPYSFDCSSSVILALKEAGFLPSNAFVGNTETLFKMEGGLLQPISRSEVRYGDIFVAGVKGASNGAFGHTGVAINNSQIIHCNATDNGIAITPIAGRTGSPCYWYRLKGSAVVNPAPSYKFEGCKKKLVTTANELNVRSQPSLGAGVVKTLNAGIEFECSKMCKNGDSVNGNSTWYEAFGGWISAYYLKDSPVVGYLECVNTNNMATNISGWLGNSEKEVSGTPWVFIMHEKEYKELARFKAEKVKRDDVKKVYLNANLDSGINVTFSTPEHLKGQKFRVMFRIADDKGENTVIEKLFDGVFEFAQKVNVGNIDVMFPVINEFGALGWHLSDKVYDGVYSYLLFMDEKTGNEIIRVDITKDSFKYSTDVVKHYPKYLSSKCRFEYKGMIPDELKGKSAKVLHRYAKKENGEDGISDLLFDRVYKF